MSGRTLASGKRLPCARLRQLEVKVAKTASKKTMASSTRRFPSPQISDEVLAARKAGLRYMIPKGPGIRRKRAGTGFAYIGEDGRPIQDEETLRRIRSLVLPP